MSDRAIDMGIWSAQEARQTARRLASAREAVLSGGAPLTTARTVISESWRRVLSTGLDPDRDRQQILLTDEDLARRRQDSALADVLTVFRNGLLPAVDGARQIMVVTDAEGVVLWREGSPPVRRMADRLGFGQGADWSEDMVGTNGIGTALVARQPVLVHSAEHFVRTHHQWTCAAAPVHDPRDGRLLGVVDVSGPAHGFHPATLSLVSAMARVAEGELRVRHQAALGRLRASAAPVLARIRGRALAVDPHGWTAAVTGMAPPDRVALPKSPTAGTRWLPRYGMCSLEPLPGGWLVRVGDPDESPGPSHVTLDVSDRSRWAITVTGPAGGWSHDLSPRHAELLFVLAAHREGRTAAELSQDLFGDRSRTVTVRAELSRLRRYLASVLAHRPYRFADSVEVELRRPPCPGDLLPHSTAPAVLAARAG
ncbi:GAF domain-containing protein [Streptomyces sp. NPDC003077]|uniref:helix-turn-helix domain-containing protein n=1 Tax=Streptomyces sp. NPDC003077 TaxID=3154443 RepID=UPI0033B23E30